MFAFRPSGDTQPSICSVEKWVDMRSLSGKKSRTCTVVEPIRLSAPRGWTNHTENV
jgi:hypothetical protein